MSAPTIQPTSAENLLARARELIRVAEERGLTMRLLGGLGVFALAESARYPPLSRTYRDFDVAVPAKQGRAATEMLVEAGFTPHKHFNALHGARRMIFEAPEGYPVDVLIGIFDMCHRLDIQSGLTHQDITIAPADLLLTKLQIVQIEPKDLADTAALLLDLPPGNHPDAIEVDRFVAPLADDWGFFHTVEINLGKLRSFVAQALPAQEGSVIDARAGALENTMNVAPKSLRWKFRSRLGERVAWYETPEEIE